MNTDEQLSTTDPSLEEIAEHGCGCPCGSFDCEYGADFFGSPEDVIRKDVYDEEYAEDMAALEEEEQLVEDTEDYNEGTGMTFDESIEGYNEFLVPPVPDGPDTIFPAAPSFNPSADNGEDVYHSTADYTMITPDSDAFDAQGS